MKKVLFLTFFLAYSFSIVYAQTADIVCDNFTNDCFFVDPGASSVSYRITITNPNNNEIWSFSNATWTIGSVNDLVDPTQVTQVGSTTSFIARKNVTNTPAKNVKATVTVSRLVNGTVQTKTLFPEKTVVIKHIAPITSMTLSGAVSATLTNNSTVSIPCGSQSLLVSVPTPITDPSASVIFTWSLPSGWSGSSTSNTINVTPSAGTSGTIAVSARRSDGTLTQSFSVGVTRPLVGTPTITAEYPANDNAICPGEYKQFKVTATGATIFSWSPISTGSLYNPNAQITLTALTSKTTLTATVNNACNAPQTTSKTVFVGVASPETATVNGGSLSVPNYIFNPALLNVWTNEVGVSYGWQVTNGTGSFYYNGQNSVSAYAYPFVRIEATISNRCGAGPATAFYLYNVSGGYYRMTSPNPATSTVSTEVIVMDALKKMTLVSDAHAGIVRMYNANGSPNADTHRNNNLLSFDVGNLPRGKYFLNFTFEGNKTFTEQIVLE